LKHSGLRLEKSLTRSFKSNEEITVGGLAVIPFAKHHDASDPFSFLISYSGVRVGVITDIGKACNRVIHYFKQCHACFLESNYDEKMLEEGGYTQRLKNRIRGGEGHLSNAQALELFVKHRSPHLSHLLLSHLSKNNNHPKVALDLFAKHAGATTVLAASRYEASAIYEITSPTNEPLIRQHAMREPGVQMKLFA
jgi:phosphoribosyl 1,2-cyclic phosphodiesterase